MTDSTGLIIDTITDVVSLGLSYQAYKDDPSLANGLGLAYDALATALPGLPAGIGIIKHAGKVCPASEKAAKDIAKRIEKDLGKDARRDFHDMKESGSGDRTMDQLKEDARSLYEQAGRNFPDWLK